MAASWVGWTESLQPRTCLDTFEIKGLRKILRVSWTAKKTHEWVLNKAGVKRELLDTVKARKLAYYGHTMRKQGSCLEKEIMQGTLPGARRRGRPRTAWMDNINTWTGLFVEESIRVTEDRDKWRKYVHGVANLRIKEGYRTEQNRVGLCEKSVSVDADCRQHNNEIELLFHMLRCFTARYIPQFQFFKEFLDETVSQV